MQMFDHAIELDPKFALAHAGIANLCGLIYEFSDRSARWIERGIGACDQALGLDPQVPEGLAARARIFYAQHKYDQAIEYARMAIGRKPDCENAYNVLGRALLSSDRLEEAAAIGTGRRGQRRRLQRLCSFRVGPPPAGAEGIGRHYGPAAD